MACACDNGLRLTGATVTRVSDSATMFASTPSYDAVNNVVSVATTLPGGTDNQGFCYDEQDRLTWAGTSGNMPCGGTVTAGTLTAAAYSQTFGYDNMDRLTSGPAGSYTYGDSAHLHAATAVGTGYTAQYGASGNMTCRAPTSSQTCAGTITGHKLTYDNEGRLTAWQNAQSSPTAMDNFLYDGEGHRVEQQSAASGVTTTTVYVGGVAELRTIAGSTTTTTYYTLGGQRVALAVNGTLSYLASDLLGSTTVALDGAGNVTASQLYAPYGASRYSSGTMPTDRGFTGQHADAVTGLDYYNARYFDPTVGQFTSADTVFDGLNGYAYVGGNPETMTDPSGHRVDSQGGGGGCGWLTGGLCSGGPTSFDDHGRTAAGLHELIDFFTGFYSIRDGIMTALDPRKSAGDRLKGAGSALLNVVAIIPPFKVLKAVKWVSRAVRVADEVDKAATIGSRIASTVGKAADVGERAGIVERFRIGHGGNFPNSLERVGWSAADYEAQAAATAKRFGINLRSTGQAVSIKYLGEGRDLLHAGHFTQADPWTVGLHRGAFVDERQLGATIAHELNHVRTNARFGIPSSEDDAYAVEDLWLVWHDRKYGGA
jgi:RHS repeat-associated protein